MRTFKDTTGREWNLSVTVGSVKRIREETDVLLTGLFDNECKLLADLSTDFIKLVDVLWVLCREQAEKEGVTAEQFAECLGGDALGEAGEALVRATADFFTSPEQRAALHQVIDKLTEAGVEFLAVTKEKVNQIDARQLARNCSDFVTNTPAKPAANLNPEPLANCS